LDLSKYFDTLNHEILINLLRRNVKDERVVQLIKRYLNVALHFPITTDYAVASK
jgi:retron-type reverse transcriptase